MSNKEVKEDPVHWPSHYRFGKFEVIEVLEDWKLNFHLANAVKYIARAGRKNKSKEIEDLEKAVWYINRHIQNLRKEMEVTSKVISEMDPHNI